MTSATREAMVRGAAAGLVASVPQAVVGKLEEKAFLPPGEDADLAPRLMDRLARLAGDRPSTEQNWVLGTLFHLGYAVAWGAAYGYAAERLRPPPLLGGAALGGLIYGITFPRWGGAVVTGTERPPERRSPQKDVMHWSVALTYGFLTAAVYHALSER